MRQTFALSLRAASVAAYAFAAFIIACSAAVMATAPAHAEAAAVAGGFVKKDIRIDGGWEIVTQADGRRVLRFDEAFSTRNGPDLKVFLSPTPIADVTGRTAVEGAVLLGVLKSNKGAQEYDIPADLDLAGFSSVLVHCEAYSKLWGGGALR